ncbi:MULTISPECIES: DUF6221 family protein [Streptomyces]|uniref:DUF6221 family protein n=1 Tax=Streptomyces TaxID=1883 RepID=UPI0010CD45FC|nr:DUF6221 family protein [Streptomyces sp. SGAir0924]QCR49833.1 hypothetical protein C1N79_26255 [Streptomyces sp. SGAir0924]
MDDLVQWLRAQLDEDEEIALAPTRATWASREWSFSLVGDDPHVDLGTVHLDRVSSLNEAEMRHISRHDPARVLRDISAKREVLDFVERRLRDSAERDYLVNGPAKMALTALDPVVRYLATAYSDRPGYREEWRPEPE